jgi:ribosomal protein L16 Arg81 hydroxylase
MEDCIQECTDISGLPNKYYPELGVDVDLKKWNLPCHEKMNFITLEPGDTFHVPVGLRHYMYGELDTHMFEFSTQHFDEDSYRVLKGD